MHILLHVLPRSAVDRILEAILLQNGQGLTATVAATAEYDDVLLVLELGELALNFI